MAFAVLFTPIYFYAYLTVFCVYFCCAYRQKCEMLLHFLSLVSKLTQNNTSYCHVCVALSKHQQKKEEKQIKTMACMYYVASYIDWALMPKLAKMLMADDSVNDDNI